MSFFDRKPYLFPVLVITLLIIFVVLTFIHLFESAGRITDENLFRDPPSKFLITNDLLANKLDSSGQLENQSFYKDTIRAGYYLYSINGNQLKTKSDLSNALKKLKKNDEIDITVIILKDKEQYFNYKVKVKDLPENFYRYLDNSILIIYVAKDGASDRAGLKVGDFIFKINGLTFENAMDADKLIQHFLENSKVKYEILRKDEIKQIDIQLAKFGIKFIIILVLFTSILFAGLGGFIGITRYKIKTARILSLAFILFGFFIVNGISSPNIFDGSLMSYIQFFALNISIALGFPMLVNLTYYFPKERTELIRKQWVSLVPLILGGMFFILCSVLFLFFLNMNNLNILRVFLLIFSLLIIIYKFSIDIRYRKLRPKDQRRIGRLIRWLAYLSLLIFAVNENGLGIVKLLSSSELIFIPVLLIPLAYLYTIGRYHLLDLNIRIRRNIQYIFLSSLWKLILICCIVLGIWWLSGVYFTIPNLHIRGTTIEVLEGPLTADMHELYGRIILIFLSIIGVLIFWKINKIGSLRIEKMFYRYSFDYKRAAIEYFDILSEYCCITDLSEVIVKEVSELLHLKRLGVVFFKNEETVCGIDFYGFQSNDLKEFCLAIGSKFVDVIKEFKGEFRVEYLQEPMKNVFHEFHLHFIVPIRSKDKVVGAFLLGEKMSEASFVRDDFEFLSSIAMQTAVAIENAYLYDDLTSQERIKHELEIARRIQLASLPQSIPNIKGLDIAGISLPAYEVGGDFYDFLNGSLDNITIVVGDVSGKGTSAALYMSTFQGILRTLNEFLFTPADLFIRANKLLYKYIDKSSFITAVGAKINILTKKVLIARAGHLPTYHYKFSENKIDRIIPHGIALGISKDETFDYNLTEIEVQFESGDIFLFISDGITEARNSSNILFEEEKLIDILMNNSKSDAMSIRDTLIASVQEFTDESVQQDDMTVVVVKIH